MLPKFVLPPATTNIGLINFSNFKSQILSFINKPNKLIHTTD